MQRKFEDAINKTLNKHTSEISVLDQSMNAMQAALIKQD
jgi:hypothetical protein